jgi:hypothetical protein
MGFLDDIKAMRPSTPVAESESQSEPAKAAGETTAKVMQLPPVAAIKAEAEQAKASDGIASVINAMVTHVDTSGNAWVTIKTANRTTFARANTNEAAGAVLVVCRSNNIKCGGVDTVKRELETAAAIKRMDCQKTDIRPRVKKDGADYLLDLNNEQGEMVRWNADGWAVEANHTHPFSRGGGHFLPTPIVCSEAEAFSAMESFFELSGTPLEMRKAKLAALVEDLRADTPYLVRINHGAAGSGKTTEAALHMQLIDPYSGMTPPQVVPDPEHMAVQSQHRHPLFIDNIKRIEDDASNFLCCAALGSPISWRAMHERQGTTTLTVHNPVYATGIGFHVPPDLADRALITVFPVRADCEPVADIMDRFNENHGRYLGALLTLACLALRGTPTVKESRICRTHRMVDFAMTGEALVQAEGFEAGAFVQLLNSIRKKQSTVIAEGDQLAVNLMDWLARIVAKAEVSEKLPAFGSWKAAGYAAIKTPDGSAHVIGSSETIRRNVVFDPSAFNQQWMPKTASNMSTAITRLQPALRDIGIRAELIPVNGKKTTAWKFIIEAGVLDGLHE